VSRRWTEADLAQAATRIRERIAHPTDVITRPRQRKRGGKYGNQKEVFQGLKFDSGREREVWQDLQTQWAAGGVRGVVRQVSLPLPGSTRRIRIDFLVIDLDGSHHWYDAKGYETAAWKSKRQQIRDAYGIIVELI
jgi:hypothetical protein